ncbi:MAG: phage tail tape measure protein, partial [bacterium]|nr:phage tail tape measure protein [bacterium]
GRVTGIAANAEVPFDDLTAAVAGLSGTLGNTNESATQVKGILSGIIKPSEGAKKAAEGLGLAFDAQTLAAKGLGPFLKDVYEATDGNIEVMSSLFGSVEALNGALVLGADKSGKFEAALLAMEDRAGATADAYDKMADSFGLTNQRLKNNLKATLIDFGAPYLDEWGLIANALGDVFKGVSVGIDEGAFDPVEEFIEESGKKLAVWLEGIAKAMPEALKDLDWEGLIKSLKGLGKSLDDLFKDFFGDVDLTNADDLKDVIQKIIEGLKTFTEVTKGIAQGIGPFV